MSATVDLPADRKVDCNGCRLCCYHQRVAVFPGLDPVELYDTEPVPGGGGKAKGRVGGQPWEGDFLFLKQQPDGACAHLGPAGCEVYEHRPLICRVFDCGDWFRSIPRSERRRMSRADPDFAPLLARGREISAQQKKV